MKEVHHQKRYTNQALVMLLQKKKSNQKRASLLEHGYLLEYHWMRHSLNSGQDLIGTISIGMRGHFSDHLLKLEDLLAFLCHGYYPTMHMGIDLLSKSSKIFSRALIQSRRSRWLWNLHWSNCQN